MFIDEAKICVVGGRGGHGRVSFRPVGKSPYKRRPMGGNGGWGGDVFIQANPQMRTLFSFTKRVHWKAESGAHGGTNSKTGKSGKSLVIPVPVGTVVKDLYTQQTLIDMSTPGERLLLVQGGLGGRGNEAFMNNRFKSPRISELGEEGEDRWIKLELKMLADVGLIGFPNAGKSSLIASMSSAKPKVGAYPFTTLEPHLGVVSLGHDEFVAVDIPGLIEGAHQGRGLGDKFLKHIERARMLVHLVDLFPGDDRDPLEDYEKINYELKAYSKMLAQKPQIVVGNKIDLLDEAKVQVHVQCFAERGIELLPLSAATGAGVRPLVQRCLQHVKALDEEAPAFDEQGDHRTYTLQEPPTPWAIVVTEDGFRVEGPKVRRLALLRLNTEDALVYLHDQLDQLGIFEALMEHGAHLGDTVFIGKNSFEFSEEPSPHL